MNKIKKLFVLSNALALPIFLALSGCTPTTPAQKMEDAAEDAAHESKQALEGANAVENAVGDAAHEVKQGMERAGENVENAVNGK